jgi:hypothetical protein
MRKGDEGKGLGYESTHDFVRTVPGSLVFLSLPLDLFHF